MRVNGHVRVRVHDCDRGRDRVYDRGHGRGHGRGYDDGDANDRCDYGYV